MTTNSCILARYSRGDGSNQESHLAIHGCSEFVALNPRIESFVSLGIFMLNTETVGALATHYGKDSGYTPLVYMEEWVRFVYTAFESMNILDKKPFMRLYTWKNLKDEWKSIDSISNEGVTMYPEADKIMAPYAGQNITYVMEDSMAIGIEIDSMAMRIHFGGEYYKDGFKTGGDQRLRKVQLPHTALRFGWSQTINIALISLKMMKMDPTLDPFYVIQIASYMRGMMDGNWSADYGHLFTQNNELIAKSVFLKAFNDRSKNGVQTHFVSTSDPLVKMVRNSTTESMDALAKNNGAIMTVMLFLKLSDKEYIERVKSFIERNTSEDSIAHLKVSFMFKSTIFKSTVIKVKYSGYKKIGKNIDRILFQDEESTILSIAEKSKLIEIL